jgi:hypothetical protein
MIHVPHRGPAQGLTDMEWRPPMDWIEQLFGISPDGGDGSTEAIIVAVCCTIVVMLIVFRQPLRRFLRRGTRR